MADTTCVRHSAPSRPHGSRPNPHRTRDATCNVMWANGTCWCEWECPHCTPATSKEKRSNLRTRGVPCPVWIGPQTFVTTKGIKVQKRPRQVIRRVQLSPFKPLRKLWLNSAAIFSTLHYVRTFSLQGRYACSSPITWKARATSCASVCGAATDRSSSSRRSVSVSF